MQDVQFSANDTIFRQGEPSEGCYRIVSGKVEIRLTRQGVLNRDETNVLATAGPGEFIGEMGAIDGGNRSASAVAVEPTTCQKLSSEEIVRILETDPQEAMRYMRTLIRRIRSSNRSMSFTARIGG